MENAGYLLAAFGVIWLGLLLYVFVLTQRQAKLRRDIELLQENLKDQQN
jgi:CcmD family protein